MTTVLHDFSSRSIISELINTLSYHIFNWRSGDLPVGLPPKFVVEGIQATFEDYDMDPPTWWEEARVEAITPVEGPRNN